MLAKLPPHLNVVTQRDILESFEQDQSGARGLTPVGVAKPRNQDDVIDFVKWANSHATHLLPVSSTGGRRRGDTLALAEDTLILDLSGLDRVIHVDGRDKIAIIEPGVDFGSIDTQLKPQGLRSHRPLKPRAGKSVLASYLDREPIMVPRDHWDVSDPLAGTSIVLGNGDFVLTGSAALEGSLANQLAKGHRHMVAPGPWAIDILKVVQGSQGTLGTMTWGAVYCEKIPAAEQSVFAHADELGPIINTARDILHQRLASTIFIVDKTQLALLMGKNTDDFRTLADELPQWTLFVSAAGYELDPEAKVAWQMRDITQIAANNRLTLANALAGLNAEGFAQDLRVSESRYYKDRPLGAHKELFCLQSVSGVEAVINAVQNEQKIQPNLPVGVYIQPMAQGTFCHIEFNAVLTPEQKNDNREIDQLWQQMTEACLQAGGFFSRPHLDWLDRAFETNPDAVALMSSAKQLFDPNHIMHPKRLPYGLVGAAS